MGKHDLRIYGIPEPVDLVGNVAPVFAVQNLPIVFLLNENHSIPDCIQQNVANARELVRNANVTLVGVESHQGGCEWDDYDECYYNPERFNPGTDPHPVSEHPEFANSLRDSGATVVGVECLGMANKEHCDFAPGGQWHGRAERDHPLNRSRSEHFLKTLFELWRRNGGAGNVILNAGGDHISHIEDWIKDGTAERIAGQKATYLHIQAPAYRPD